MTGDRIRAEELRDAMKYAGCHEDVTRGGMSQPCNKQAVAIRLDPEENTPYPVCSYHTRGKMIPVQILWEAANWLSGAELQP